MTPRASLLALGKVVAMDLARNRLSQGALGVGEALFSQPDSVLIVLDLLIAEVRKKRPSQGLVSAFIFMLQGALEAARQRIENQSAGPTDLVENVRAALVKAASSKTLPLEAFVMISECFAAARLDIGDEVRQTFSSSVPEGNVRKGPEPTRDEFETHLGRLAEGLDHDPFLIQSQLAESFSGLPAGQRVEMIGVLAFSPLASLREAVPGWLLETGDAIGNAVADLLAQAAGKGLVSATTVNRLILLRNWVSDDRRKAIDAVIRAARQHGSSAPAKSEPAKSAIQIGEVLASSCDGAGAQSFVVVTRQKRKLSIAGALVKHGFGVRDAWVRNDLGLQEVEELLDHIELEVGGFDTSLDAMQTALSHALAVNRQANEPIPFGLVQFVEAIGLASVGPALLSAEVLLGRLLEQIPEEQRNEAAVLRSLSASKRWRDQFAWLDSWFEDSGDALRAFRSEKTAKARADAVLRSVIDNRRKRWGELLAWTALAASDAVDGDDWIGFALVAGELLGNRPIADIPLAKLIAQNTVAALNDRS